MKLHVHHSKWRLHARADCNTLLCLTGLWWDIEGNYLWLFNLDIQYKEIVISGFTKKIIKKSPPCHIKSVMHPWLSFPPMCSALSYPYLHLFLGACSWFVALMLHPAPDLFGGDSILHSSQIWLSPFLLLYVCILLCLLRLESLPLRSRQRKLNCGRAGFK